jgi:GNAT superfamily N-acetyltransferase
VPEKVGPGVAAVFAHPEHGFYLVAEMDGAVAGCLLVTYEWSDWRNGVFWWIQSVYVLPQCRRRGVYRALYEGVKARAARHPEVCGCRLYVERSNYDAQEVYRRLGLGQTRYLVFEEPLGAEATGWHPDVPLKWYFRGESVVIAILAVGPLALPLIWWHPRLPRSKKVSYTILVLLLTLVLLALFALLLWQLIYVYRMTMAM